MHDKTIGPRKVLIGLPKQKKRSTSIRASQKNSTFSWKSSVSECLVWVLFVVIFASKKRTILQLIVTLIGGKCYTPSQSTSQKRHCRITQNNQVIQDMIQRLSDIVLEEKRQTNATIETYEITILKYNDNQFKLFFRISRTAFDKFFGFVRSHDCFQKKINWKYLKRKFQFLKLCRSQLDSRKFAP